MMRRSKRYWFQSDASARPQWLEMSEDSLVDILSLYLGRVSFIIIRIFMNVEVSPNDAEVGKIHT